MEGLSLWPKIRKPLAAAVSTRGGASELHAHCPGLRGLWPGARKSLHAGTQARRHAGTAGVCCLCPPQAMIGAASAGIFANKIDFPPDSHACACVMLVRRCRTLH
jgi:hypothetical protein